MHIKINVAMQKAAFTFYKRYRLFLKLLPALMLLCCCMAYTLHAQNAATTAAKKVPIQIVHNQYMEAFKTDSLSYFKFIGDVQFLHGSDTLYCDTALLNQEKNNLEAFGNVKIAQANGTTAVSDYLSYTGNIKKAYLRGNVALSSGADNLWTEELDYNLNTKIGNYYQNGTLQTGVTTVSSTMGTYNAETKESRFIDQVYVSDTAFSIESKDLGYNTESKMMRFFDSTEVSNESALLKTSGGTYDSKLQIAHFNTRSSIQNEEQYIEGDSLDYNKQSGLGKAIGKVIVLDTAQNTSLYCGKAFYNDKMKTILAILKPVMKRKNEKDSIYVRADTFYSAYLGTKTDTIPLAKTQIDKKSTKRKAIKTQQDTFQLVQHVDTTSAKYYSGYHHVKIFSDSLQGKCDSVSFEGKDSVMLMMYEPIVWSRRSQITGDTIIAYIDSAKVQKIVVPHDAFIVSKSGPDQAGFFNQVKGVRLEAYMLNDALDHAIVWPNANSIYYPTDDDGAYIGVTEASSEKMKIYFDEGEIKRLLMLQDVKQKLSPIQKVNIPDMKLEGFKWLEEFRPKSIEELFYE